MPRRARQESNSGFYHVISRGLDKEAVFRESAEKERLWKLLQENCKKYDIAIYAYCIMSNHFHLLLKADLKNLSQFMAKVLATYAVYYNYKHDRIGYVFQGRFRSQCVEKEGYFWNCLRYIHLNPVKANLCKKADAYWFSSMREYLNPNQEKLLHAKAYRMLQKRFQSGTDFEEFHKSASTDFFIDIREEEQEQRTAIGEDILRDMQENSGLPAKEILDYAKTRDHFEKKLRKRFGISKKKAHEIQKLLKSQMEQLEV